jgi:CheY-like chemotaxis protein
LTEPSAPRVLVVEDEPLVRDVICDDLRDAGFRVDEAGDGDAALAKLHADHDILLTDIRLPGHLNGWDIAERAREVAPDIRVLYLTGYTPQVPRMVPGGRLLAKPCTGSQLLAVIRALGGDD